MTKLCRFNKCTAYRGAVIGLAMTTEEFSRLVEQYERFVFTICYQMVRDYQEAQNLSQETFISAYRHIGDCDPANYRPWLARIASNKAKDYLKSAHQRHESLVDDGELPELLLEKTPEDIFVSKDTSRRIQEKINSLEEPYLKVSTLYFLEEKNVEEIARALFRPKKTVQTQLYRAKQILQKMLKEERQL